jgi:hypothetical protein
MGAKVSQIVAKVPENNNAQLALILKTVVAVLTNKKIPTGKITKEQSALLASMLDKLATDLEKSAPAPGANAAKPANANAGTASAVPGTSATPATVVGTKRDAEGKPVETVVQAGTPGTRTPEQESARQQELQKTETVTKGAEAKPGGTLVGGSRKRKGKYRSKHRSSRVPK